ncbi:DNA (cytosine-5-)-methyltransferase [Pseudidiomarina aquimaris]|uniref:Cytosine-specific methyltransferase n=1 Tax=Pseudidiomarina aquimaris TaxID=641841 RepID=A0A432XHR7_9GAMM|nr:DNA cytosine methyltransferase [Pseudidiomarina aquimaris]RUO48268.1 DNA (cytosine-5-)-methyltransferase [Pseudidiomarina aquimaris]
MNYIELFAGCGGLSLGLERAGFELLFANELSPMAGESYAYNILHEDLSRLAQGDLTPSKTLWLNSAYPDLKRRLRENPFEFPPLVAQGYSDLKGASNTISGKLVIGSIVELNKLLEQEPSFLKSIRNSNNGEGVDLISGGPPCQSFSMAGLRRKDCDKNTLPWEFAKFVAKVRPKMAMLENVTGILRAFRDVDGNKYYAWFEVAKAFAQIGYIPLCLHINARFAGVPQNRPRFILMAFREDFFKKWMGKNESQTHTLLFKSSINFFEKLNIIGIEPQYGDLKYFDSSKPQDRELMNASFLYQLQSINEVTVRDAIDDLKENHPSLQSEYVSYLNNLFNMPSGEKLFNHEKRSNSPTVQRRFRIYQILQQLNESKVTRNVMDLLKGQCRSLSYDSWIHLRSFKFKLQSGELAHFGSKEELEQYLLCHPTKKQTQKALNPDQPAPAALSIPDDGCHYDERELRVFSVREMARIQSFPDGFVFRSKITTGGRMRRFEVPQYTQVGNAVPPLLAYRLGMVCSQVLNFDRQQITV